MLMKSVVLSMFTGHAADETSAKTASLFRREATLLGWVEPPAGV